MYVTLEPCLMCVGALVHARVGTLVFGTTEPKAGAVESTQRAHEHPALNHRLTRGVRACWRRSAGTLMQEFFRDRRARVRNLERSDPAEFTRERALLPCGEVPKWS